MNIHKLELILEEMQAATFASVEQAEERVRAWSERIQAAITEHLLESVGGGAVPPPALSDEPGGHGWE